MGVGEGDGEIGHHLGWDASDVEAGPAEGAPLLDAGGLEPQLCGLDRRHVPSGPAAHHHHVALLARRRVRPPGGHGRPGRRLRPPQHGRRRPPPRQDSERHLSLSPRALPWSSLPEEEIRAGKRENRDAAGGARSNRVHARSWPYDEGLVPLCLVGEFKIFDVTLNVLEDVGRGFWY